MLSVPYGSGHSCSFAIGVANGAMNCFSFEGCEIGPEDAFSSDEVGPGDWGVAKNDGVLIHELSSVGIHCDVLEAARLGGLVTLSISVSFRVLFYCAKEAPVSGVT